MDKYRKIWVFALTLLFSNLANAETLVAHCRDRSPELIPTHNGCSGPVAEIIDIASNRIGLEVSWITVPWARTIKVAEYGGVDIIPRHSMNQIREAFLNGVAYGYQKRNVYYMISPQTDVEVNDLSDLEGLKVGALRGSFYSENFANAQHFKKLFFNNTEQIIRMLNKGRIDVAVMSSNHHEEKFRAESGLRQARYVDVFYNGRYISMPIESPMVKHWPMLKEQIDEMRTDGDIEKIFKKYHIPPPEQK
ncbi:substrate-binding periplasmic protein [Vibrio marisflavi]|uniref:Solute-binding protein family 3/N-terminal domain-containing protein n=1 Tax=Vibrio marisflavi CECT 7928 TaxID=634439 RepID=A0ABM9A1D6_9VIBR|nr:transporter substrate-binding domain-containing protein [Vibrio marisflavi]CAH0536843.1 hypothetical protein VMF7928_00734 [Vibrio marisflavi CECT 7928]